MTQLVELQEAMPKFTDAGIKLYAISYDELGALADFAANHDITYDLLADEGSAVIRSFGILNHHVTPDQIPYHGIPFPGTYLVDEAGIVTAKSFNRANGHRESAEALIDDALGEILLRPEDPTVDVDDDTGIRFSMTYHGGGGVIRGGGLRRLVIRAELPDGLHLYDDPVPDGMVATSITLLGPDGIRHLPVERPPTEPLELPGIGTLQVWSGRVDFVLPIWATDELSSLLRDDAPDQVTIEVELAYQACDDRACRLPRTERLTLEVAVDKAIGPALRNDVMAGAEKTTMDTTRWLGAMVERGLEATPDREAALAYLQRTAQSLAEGPGGASA
ncbi:MAG: redoxin domain-containing protein [Actinomycetota bacterium]